MPATINAIVTDGPDRSAIAAAVRTKRPAPMIAPMPSATRADGPSVRLSVPSPLAAASDSRRSIDLVRNSEPATMCPLSPYDETPTLYRSTAPRPDALGVGAHARLWISGAQQIADHR